MTLNGSILFGWQFQLISLYYLLLVAFFLTTGSSEFDKIHPLAQKYHSRFVCENYFRKVNFHVFLGQIVMLWNIFTLVRGVCIDFFYRSQFTKYSRPLVLLESLDSSLWNIWVLVKSDYFTVTRFSLHLSEGSKFFIVWWSLQSSFDISKVNIPSLINFVIFSFSAVCRPFPLSIFQKEKCFYFRCLWLILV